MVFVVKERPDDEGQSNDNKSLGLRINGLHRETENMGVI